MPLRAISRRSMLRVAGVGLGLPLLEAMVPGGRILPADEPGMFVTKRRPQRAIWLFQPNGLAERHFWPEYITPVGEGRTFRKEAIGKLGGPPVSNRLQFFDLHDMPGSLAPLSPWRDRLLVVGGLDMGHCKNHIGTAPMTLGTRNARHLDPTGYSSCMTVDQALAKQTARATPIPSLQLRAFSPGKDARSSTLSWKEPGVPSGQLHNPRQIFGTLFGNPVHDRERTSILDMVREQAKGYRDLVGANDRHTLDEYLHVVRETEKRILDVERIAKERGRPELDDEYFEYEDEPELINLQYDLMILGLRADMTRWCTKLLHFEGGDKAKPWHGVYDDKPLSSHGLSHIDSDDLLKHIDLWAHRHYAELLKRLAVTPDGDGTLLDSTRVMLTHGMNNGSHKDDNTTQIIAGGPPLQNFGKAVVYPSGTKQHRLWLGQLEAYGVPVDGLDPDREVGLKEVWS